MPLNVYNTAIGFLGGVVLLYGLSAYFFVYRYLGPRSRRWFVGLLATEIVLVTIHLLWVEVRTTFWSWFVNLEYEMTAGAIFSVTQYTLVVILTALIASQMPQLKTGQRIYWAFIAVVMAWLAFDEYFAVHEAISWWRSAYSLGGLGVVLISAITFAVWYRDQPGVFLPVLVGLILMGVSGVILDVLTNDHPFIVAGQEIRFVQVLGCDSPWWPFIRCRYMNKLGFVEEFLEMAGVTTILTALINQVERRMDAHWLRFSRTSLAAVAGIWLGITAWNLWGEAGIAVRSAQPLDAGYLDDRIELVGYRMTPTSAQPGDTVSITIYARLTEPIPDDYLLSVHMLTRFEGESRAQADTQLGEWLYPTSAWIPGAIVRNRLTFTVPSHLDLPQSYWITATVWREGEPATISHTDRFQVDTDTVVLRDLPVTALGSPPEPAISTNYRFPADGLILAGVDLPETAMPGDTIVLRFWWQTTGPVPGDYQQFVHLIQSETDTALNHDQSPFGGDRFPTSDWPAGMYEVATWQMEIPPDAPTGTYEVYSGLYTLPDLTRRDVIDREGQPVLNNALKLGDITLTEAP